MEGIKNEQGEIKTISEFAELPLEEQKKIFITYEDQEGDYEPNFTFDEIIRKFSGEDQNKNKNLNDYFRAATLFMQAKMSIDIFAEKHKPEYWERMPKEYRTRHYNSLTQIQKEIFDSYENRVHFENAFPNLKNNDNAIKKGKILGAANIFFNEEIREIFLKDYPEINSIIKEMVVKKEYQEFKEITKKNETYFFSTIEQKKDAVFLLRKFIKELQSKLQEINQ